MATRIYVLLARRGQSALVFRRGPGKNVLLLRWDLRDDTLEDGHWFKGHIYERRCDLSPSGEHLVYFAAKWKGKYPSFTAVSRPPWLTALALWEGLGAWGGGGLFHDERTLLLNKRGDTKPKEGAAPPQVRIAPIGAHAGRGEDDPIWHTRLVRDGWTLVQAGTWHEYATDGLETTIAGDKTSVRFKIDPPRIYRRVMDHATIEMRIGGLHEINGPWYAVEHALFDPKGRELASLGRAEWADFDEKGDLLFARDGRIFRAKRAKLGEPRELFDLRDRRFERRIAPPWARQWLTRRPP